MTDLIYNNEEILVEQLLIGLFKPYCYNEEKKNYLIKAFKSFDQIVNFTNNNYKFT